MEQMGKFCSARRAQPRLLGSSTKAAFFANCRNRLPFQVFSKAVPMGVRLNTVMASKRTHRKHLSPDGDGAATLRTGPSEHVADNGDLIDQTIALWQGRSARKLTREDGREIIENMTGFFRILQEWEQAEQAAKRPTKRPPSRPGTSTSSRDTRRSHEHSNTVVAADN